MSLTPKLERFCQEIVKGRNQSNAYRAAISSRGQPNTIHINASKLMAQTKVRLRIEELKAPVVKDVRVSMGRRLKELECATLLDPAECFDDHGRPLLIREMPEQVRHAIAGYEVDPETFVTKVRFVDKRAAIMDYSKLVGDIPNRSQRHESRSEPGLVSMERFGKLSLDEQLAMRQRLLAVLQECVGPRLSNG